MRYTQPISKLVADTLEELGLHDNQFVLLSRFAINFMRTANNDVKGEIKTERFEVPASRVIALPSDFIDYTKIGVQFKEGVKALARNPYMAMIGGADLPRAYPPPPATTINGQNASTPFGYFYGYSGWTNGTGRITAFGNGNELGKWTIINNATTKQLRLSSDYDLNSNVYIEYLSDCIDPNTETFIHPYMQLCCQYWMKWHYYLRKENLNMAREFERLYNDEYIQMKYRYGTLDIPTIVNLVEFYWGLPE
jgi:hypothetical protein